MYMMKWWYASLWNVLWMVSHDHIVNPSRLWKMNTHKPSLREMMNWNLWIVNCQDLGKWPEILNCDNTHEWYLIIKECNLFLITLKSKAHHLVKLRDHT